MINHKVKKTGKAGKAGKTGKAGRAGKGRKKNKEKKNHRLEMQGAFSVNLIKMQYNQSFYSEQKFSMVAKKTNTKEYSILGKNQKKKKR